MTVTLAPAVNFQQSTVSFSDICKALRKAHRILVVSHARPDGDALGSTLAAALWLRDEGHQVTAWNEDGLPEKFSFLPESYLISKPSAEQQEFDAVFILDTAAKSRLGAVLQTRFHAPLWVTLDHHISNECFGNLNVIDATAPATGQILAEGFLNEGITITPAMAANLYVAISTDTGSFQYSQTSAQTLRIAASLVDAGVNVGEISQAMYDSQPRRRFDLLRHALGKTEFSLEGRIASFTLTLADASGLGIQPDDTEGIIDHLRAVEGVEVAIFFEELPGNLLSQSTAAATLKAGSDNQRGLIRISVRSKNNNFDTSAFCQHYGGGGHRLAAGARIHGVLEAVKKEVLARIAETLSKK